MMRVSRTKVYDLMRTGKLRSIKVDGLRRIPREAIAEYVDSQSG
jgi:excisionase family DNA binding protein